MSDMDFEIVDGKGFRDLCRDIIERSDSKKNQVDMLYSDMRAHIKDAASALNFIPQLKALLDTGVKNDEQLIKLAAILQRFQTSTGEGGSPGGLSEEDKAQLIREVEEVRVEIEKDIEISESTGSNKPI